MRTLAGLAMLRILFGLVATIASVDSQGGSPPSSVPELLELLAPTAPAPGKKDTADTLGPMLIGWANQDSGERRAGYYGMIPELHLTQPAEYQQITLNGVSVAGPDISTSWGVLADLYDVKYVNAASNFSTTAAAGEDSDLDRAFMPPGVNFFAHQSTIYQPLMVDVPGESIECFGATWLDHWVHSYPNLRTQFEPSTPPEARFAQAVGFASSAGITTGDFAFSLGNGLKLKEPVFTEDQWHLSMVSVFFDTFDDKLLLHIPLSILDRDVLAGMRCSIEDRVQALPEGRVAYNAISGEFYTFRYESEPIYSMPQSGCDDLENGDEFFDCLSWIDYSDETMAHFRAWLDRKYGEIASLETAWAAQGLPCSDIPSCSELNPLILKDMTLSLDAVFADWRAFQEEQHFLDAYLHQYAIAKLAVWNAQRSEPCCLLNANALGAERSALYSDGSALLNWYNTRESKQFANRLLTPMRRLALHAQAYGEALHFPFFGMPRDDFPDSPPWLDPKNPNGPPSYYPTGSTKSFSVPAFDVDFCERTLREFHASGIDSVGMAYFEQANNWTIVDAEYGGSGVHVVEALSGEALLWRDEHAFMTPIRSPLLVHTGAAADVGKENGHGALYQSGDLAADVVERLARAQIQFQVFSLGAGVKDLWLTSHRDLVLSAFAPDLDLDFVVTELLPSVADDTHVIVLVDRALGEALAAEITALQWPRITSGTDPVVGYEMPGSSGAVTREFWRLTTDDAALIDGYLDKILPDVDPTAGGDKILPLTDPIVRPIRAVDASTGGAIDDADVAVATDGLGFLVSVANAGPDERMLTLAIDYQAPEGIQRHVVDGTSTFTLAPGQAALRYVEPVVPSLAALEPELLTELQNIQTSKLPALAGYETESAELLLDALFDQVDVPAGQSIVRPEKALAGLLRLHRTPFVRLEVLPGGQTGRVHVRTIDGQAVKDAPVQLEFVLLRRHRTPVGLTDDMGQLDVSLVPPDAAIEGSWNLETLEYAEPPQLLVEVHAQHPVFGSHGRQLVEVQ